MEDTTMVRARRCGHCFALLAWLVVGIACAAAPATSPGTGDPWVDAVLVDIDRYAARYPDAFVDELARYHGAPRELAASLLAGGRWTAGDLYFACALGQYAGQPCRSVAAARDRDRTRDWSLVARDLGVAPGSDAFQRIKRAIVRSYGRWARPLQVDASLHAEFPEHAVAPATSPAKPAGDRR
ncbi:MAG: hypothetical protein ACJ8GK_04345 [Luteimonas sp.]